MCDICSHISLSISVSTSCVDYSYKYFYCHVFQQLLYFIYIHLCIILLVHFIAFLCFHYCDISLYVYVLIANSCVCMFSGCHSHSSTSAYRVRSVFAAWHVTLWCQQGTWDTEGSGGLHAFTSDPLPSGVCSQWVVVVWVVWCGCVCTMFCGVCVCVHTCSTCMCVCNWVDLYLWTLVTEKDVLAKYLWLRRASESMDKPVYIWLFSRAVFQNCVIRCQNTKWLAFSPHISSFWAKPMAC